MPTTKGARPGAASTIVTVLSAAGIAGALLYSSTIPGSSRHVTAPVFAAPKTSSRLELSPERLLRESGVNPDALATVGATAQETTSVVSAAREYLTEHATDLANALQADRTARQQQANLEAIVQAGQASQEQLTLLASVRVTSLTAKGAAESAKDALVAAALTPLSAGQRTALSNIRAATCQGTRLPAPFLVTVRTEAERIAIREALAESKISQRRSVSLSEASQTILSQAREDTATSQAESNLAENGSTVSAAWTTAFQ